MEDLRVFGALGDFGTGAPMVTIFRAMIPCKASMLLVMEVALGA